MANSTPHLPDEHQRVHQILSFRLPHQFKMAGIIGALSILLFLVIYRFQGSNMLLIKDVLRTIILLCMLVASLSSDKVEDEYSKYIRFQSHVIAFVVTIVYAVCIPLIAVLLDTLITIVSGDGAVSFYDISAFEVVFSLLGIQLLAQATLKQLGRV